MADQETQRFLATGRMSPAQAARIRLQSKSAKLRAQRKRVGTVRKQAGEGPAEGEVRGLFGRQDLKKPKPGKPPKGKRKPPHRLLPIRPDRKGPRRIKKPAERISSFHKFNIGRDVRKRA